MEMSNENINLDKINEIDVESLSKHLKDNNAVIDINENINVDNIMYHSYPNFVKSLNRSNEYYNFLCDDLERLSDDGRVFVISPSEQIEINRLEGDMEKLGKFYYLGYNDTKKCVKKLKDYLNN